MSKYPTKKQSIITLIQTIRDEIEAGKASAEAALEAEKTITYWKVGRHIHNFLQANKSKDDYGDAVIKQIAQALEIGYRTLYSALSFYEQYPETPDAQPRLTWTHFRILSTVKDETIRQTLENRILSEGLSTRKLLELARAANQNLLGYDYIKKLTVNRGQPCVYRIKINKNGKQEKKCLDLGFKVYIDAEPLGLSDYPEGTIFRVEFRNKKPVFNELPTEKIQQLFTYESYIKEIIDGDTLWINLELGFNISIVQKIRLRGINAASIETNSGQKAKAFIENRLKACEKIIVKTHSRDKYDRYLGDLFYNPETANLIQIAENGSFLNQDKSKGLDFSCYPNKNKIQTFQCKLHK